MKKIIVTFIAFVMLSVPALAEGVNSPVAVRTDEGVFLSWPMEEAGRTYTVYRDGEAIATTKITNYTDIGASGEGEYMIDETPVDVWDASYIKIPLSLPTPYENVRNSVKAYTVKPLTGPEMAIGSDWTVFPQEDGYCGFLNPEGVAMDVVDWKVDPGSEVYIWEYHDGDCQKFLLEETTGGYYIKAKQSGLYIKVDAEGGATIEKKENATVFSATESSQLIPEGAANVVNSMIPTYSPADASVGDLDGDGEWEIVLKWDPSNAKDSSHNGVSGRVFIDAYKLDGTFMWRIDMGKNIRAGAHDTQLVVYDFDSDGRAEMAVRTADGTVDGKGNVIGDPDKDWRDGGGRNLTGPLYMAVFDGETGELAAMTDFYPQNTPDQSVSKSFGDGYGNRSERYNACVAYLDGENPYIIYQRGYYARTTVSAYRYENGEVRRIWSFDSADEGKNQYGGNGNHQISVGDADNDGRDEIFLGSLTLNDDGSVLWCSFKGHGDTMHLGDFDPDHEGLEFFSVHEGAPFGYTIYDAATGEIYYDIPGAKDTGRGLILNPGPFRGYYIIGVGSGAQRINSLGESTAVPFNPANFRVYWDGDLYEESLGGTVIEGFDLQGNAERLLEAWDYGAKGINGTKSTPCLTADIFGDWREEIVWAGQDNSSLYIFTTTIPSDYAVPSPMTDHIYRMGVVWQNSSYNQPPHLGYFLDWGMTLKIGAGEADINGVKIPLDAPAYISEEGRTMVPLRFISERFDADVEFENGSIRITKDGDVFETTVGSDKYTLNGEERTMDTASVIVNDRTMVPVRAVAEAFEMKVEWNGETREITLRNKNMTAPEIVREARD